MDRAEVEALQLPTNVATARARSTVRLSTSCGPPRPESLASFEFPRATEVKTSPNRAETLSRSVLYRRLSVMADRHFGDASAPAARRVLGRTFGDAVPRTDTFPIRRYGAV
jgi:hypothetical protein